MQHQPRYMTLLFLNRIENGSTGCNVRLTRIISRAKVGCRCCITLVSQEAYKVEEKTKANHKRARYSDAYKYKFEFDEAQTSCASDMREKTTPQPTEKDMLTASPRRADLLSCVLVPLVSTEASESSPAGKFCLRAVARTFARTADAFGFNVLTDILLYLFRGVGVAWNGFLCPATGRLAVLQS